MWSGRYLVVDVVAADAVGVHEVGAAVAGGGRALRHVGVVLGAPVVAELVRRHEVRLARDHALPVVVARRRQTRVQVQGVPILEVLCKCGRRFIYFDKVDEGISNI